ncbi:DUF6090 family protein [Robiginitalea sp. SC105]|uniref:DUF6090 family protein n=1 Tax=Robiginitalea sp. SC105 TaxID=2762332 RepID=UPI00163A6439|nr:DUF6090 family protein [Robiginitalea sp. SC105]MBC2838161.1 hypothetical protein [Robiginitalea sp. SC105]
MLYAIGEIVLVVIGILIALQINTWNETRKSRAVAREIYINLLTSMQQDSMEVKRAILLQTRSLAIQKDLILSPQNPYAQGVDQDTLDQKLGYLFGGIMSFYPKSGVYELITSNNSMELLESDQIKSRLINLYDFQYKRYQDVDATVDQKFHNQLNSLIRKKIRFLGTYNAQSEFTFLSHADPDRFNANYEELVSECRDVYGALSTGRNYLLQIQESLEELMALIRTELNKD